MSKPSVPRPPDPNVVAQAQTNSNLATSAANQIYGNTNVNSPYGQVNYSYQPGPGGIRQATQTTTLNPEQQHLLDLQTQQSSLLGQLGIDQTNQASALLGGPYNPHHLDVNGATGGPLDINSQLGRFGADSEARTRELLNRGVGEWASRGQESLDSRLANQGINAGSDAWGSSQQAFSKGVGDAYAGNELAARQQAMSDRGQNLSEILSQRGTNLGDAQTQNSANNAELNASIDNPLNRIIGLANGNQVNSINPGAPNSPTMAGTDIAGINANNFGQQMARYNAQYQNAAGPWSALSNLGAAAITHFSDPRLKRDVSYHHTDANGLRWWNYRYLWDAATAPLRLGVMATEAPAHAVHVDPAGWLMVDYGAL